MTDAPDTLQTRYDLLRRLRSARRDFHYALMHDAQTRERVFAPAHLLRTLREQVDQSAGGTTGERCSRLFILSVLVYGALDWHYAGHGVDIEADVQLERMHQNDRYGGPQLDDRLSVKDWQTRMHYQILRLEQQLAVEELYAARLIKLAALVQAALEAASRQVRAA
jgi:hypothetical protein